MSKANDPAMYFEDPQVIELCRAVINGDIPKVDALLASGAKVNARGKDGMTPLLFSMAGFDKAGIKRLMEHGADPNLQMDNKDSFMRFAARANDSDYLIIAFALGGDPNLKGKMERTLLFETAMENNENVLESLKLLLKNGADINAIDRSMENAAMAAAGISQYEPALFLLERGADFSQKDRWGYTIKHPLEENGIGYNPGFEGYDARTRVAQFLIDKGIEVQLKEPYEAASNWLEASFSAIGKSVPGYLK